MSDALTTYLNDHLGGAQMAVQVLEAMRDQNDDQEFRQFASVLLPEIEADHRTLRHLAEEIGPGPNAIKTVGGWLVEKATRLKLGHSGSKTFELFESLELLALGIQGKLSLWTALQAASACDVRLQTYDFGSLQQRARQQYATVESQRIKLARTVLSP